MGRNTQEWGRRIRGESANLGLVFRLAIDFLGDALSVQQRPYAFVFHFPLMELNPINVHNCFLAGFLVLAL
jgi:hypothetical protein